MGTAGIYIYFQVGKTENKQSEKKVAKSDDFSLEKAPSESLRGRIASVSGKVNWLSRIAKKETVLDPAQEIQQGEEISTKKNSSATVEIAGTSIIKLFSESHVSFIQTMPANIVIEQTEGFVDYEMTGNIPLSVRIFDLLVQIKGEAEVTSDQSNNVVKVLVKKGTARLAYNDLENVSVVRNIVEGNIFVFENESREGVLR